MEQEGEQYLTVPPLVYGITPQESLAGMDRESEKRDSPFLDQTILRVGDKQDQFPIQIDEVTTPLTQFTQNIMGTSVVMVKPKTKTTQTKTSTQQMPIQPDLYLPDGKGSRLSEVHQINTKDDKWGFGYLIGWFVGGTGCTLQTLYAWLMRGFGIGMVGILNYRVLCLSLRCDSCMHAMLLI